MLYAKGSEKNMGKNKKNGSNNCLKCQFYDPSKGICKIKDITEYNKKDGKNCDDYLVKDSLIMF